MDCRTSVWQYRRISINTLSYIFKIDVLRLRFQHSVVRKTTLTVDFIGSVVLPAVVDTVALERLRDAVLGGETLEPVAAIHRVFDLSPYGLEALGTHGLLSDEEPWKRKQM